MVDQRTGWLVKDCGVCSVRHPSKQPDLFHDTATQRRRQTQQQTEQTKTMDKERSEQDHQGHTSGDNKEGVATPPFVSPLVPLGSTEVMDDVNETSEEADDFFGDDDYDDNDDNKHKGLSGHELDAAAAKFKNLGFHEAFESSKEDRLQEGFEEGYTDAYSTATRIGILLGKATSCMKLNDPNNTENNNDAGSALRQILSEIHTFLLEMDRDGSKKSLEDLHALETKVNQALS